MKSFFSWLRTRKSSSTQTHPSSRGAARPALEALEDRCLPSFMTPVNYGKLSSPNALTSADLNGDGKADLVSVTAGFEVVAMLNNGKGKFPKSSARGVVNGADSVTAVAVGDLNGDGKADVITGNDPGDGGSFGERASFSVLLGKGDGTFGTLTFFHNILSLHSGPRSLVVADFNGDGRADLAFSNEYDGEVDVVINPGFNAPLNHWFSSAYPAADFAAGYGAGALVAGDFNGDGKTDLFASSGFVLLNKGAGTFTPQAAGSLANSVAVGDVNGDGKLDLVTTSFAGNSVSVLLGNGDGTFAAARSCAVGAASWVALGDFNKDGKLDVVTAGAEMDLLLGNGDGTFKVAKNVGPAGSRVVEADFNGDGFPDLAQVDATATTINVLLNKDNWK